MTKLKPCKINTKCYAVLLSIISVALIVGGFFVPPMGVIDGSVLTGAGEIIGIMALFMTWESIDKGIDAKFTHGSTTVELNNPDTPKSEEEEQ